MDYLNSFMIKPDIDISIDNIPGRKEFSFKQKAGEVLKLPTFYDREDVTGKLTINIKSCKKFEHLGIKVELVGCIENIFEKRIISKFITLAKDLEPPSSITNEITTLKFKFSNVEKEYESYTGTDVRVRYYILATILTKTRIHTEEKEFGVVNPLVEFPNSNLQKITI